MKYQDLCSELLERTKEQCGTYREAALRVSEILAAKAPFITDTKVHGNWYTMMRQRGFTKMAVTVLAALQVAGYKIVKADGNDIGL